MKQRLDRSTRRGFTVLELAVALVLFALVIGNVYTVLGGTSKAMGERNASFEADTQARRALDRIALAIVGSFGNSIYDTSETPNSQSVINYEEYLGVADLDGDGVSENVFSENMRIALTDESGGEVTWFESPGSESEKRVVWVKDVPQFANGEIGANGIDDNGNGLVDERGLALVKDGKSVRITLSLRRSDGAGGFLERELSTTVTCRN